VTRRRLVARLSVPSKGSRNPGRLGRAFANGLARLARAAAERPSRGCTATPPPRSTRVFAAEKTTRRWRRRHRGARAGAEGFGQMTDRRPPAWRRLTAVEPSSEQSVVGASACRSEATVADHASATVVRRSTVGLPTQSRTMSALSVAVPTGARMHTGRRTANRWPATKPKPNRRRVYELRAAGTTTMCNGRMPLSRRPRLAGRLTNGRCPARDTKRG
jgi:hypothetical protein